MAQDLLYVPLPAAAGEANRSNLDNDIKTADGKPVWP
jgi:hypothetical protein